MTTSASPAGTDRLPFGTDGLNSAGAPAKVAAHAETPVPLFFTRSHAPTPAIDRDAWVLEVDGLVRTPLRLTFGDLQRFTPREVTATMLCAGLRRVELLAIGPLPGELPWGVEPVGTARWRGVSLCDVLAAAGVQAEARHIEFTGLDAVERHGEVFGFGGSIDAGKAQHPDVLLAWEQNGAPLTPEHGYPVRMVVPGWIGARSVKWLGRITASASPSSNYFQTKAYRVQKVRNPDLPTDVTAGVPLAEVTLNSAIMTPVTGQQVPVGSVTVSGWAIGTGGAAVSGVEVSADGGLTWAPAQLEPVLSPWSWTRWTAEVSLPAGAHVLTVRATDVTGASQPSSLAEVWNVKGYLNNAWHRVTVLATGA